MNWNILTGCIKVSLGRGIPAIPQWESTQSLSTEGNVPCCSFYHRAVLRKGFPLDIRFYQSYLNSWELFILNIKLKQCTNFTF